MTDEPNTATAASPLDTGTEVSRIDAPYKSSAITDIAIEPGEGVMLRTLPQMVEAAKLMARADIALPPHARDNPSICFALLMQTDSWHLRNPFFVAGHSYVVEQSRKVNGQWQNVQTLAYDSAVFQAALLASGAIRGRPQYEYSGDGQDRVCTVRVQLPSGVWEELSTPPIKTCHPGYVEKDGKKFVKGSPLWDRNGDQQQAYYALRNLVRLKFQDVLGGFYDREERDEYPELDEDLTDAVPATPNLLSRLPGRVGGDGFQPDTVGAAQEEATALARAEEIRRNRKAAAKPSRGAKRGKTATSAPSVGASRARQTAKGVAEGQSGPKLAPTTPATTPAAMVKGAEGA